MEAKDLPALHHALRERWREEEILPDVGLPYPRDVDAMMFADRFKQPTMYFWQPRTPPGLSFTAGEKGYLRLARDRRLPRLRLATLPSKHGLLALQHRTQLWRLVCWIPSDFEEEHLHVYAVDLFSDDIEIPYDYMQVNYPLVKPLDQVEYLAKNGHTSDFDTAQLAAILNQLSAAVAADSTPTHAARPSLLDCRRAARDGLPDTSAVRIVTSDVPILNPANEPPTDHAPYSAKVYQLHANHDEDTS